MTAKPPYADDWEGLAAVAERLRDDRARDDPRHVQSKKLSQQQADDRARISQALALQWRAIARREPIQPLEAGHIEIRADLVAAATATARRAASDPNTAVQLAATQVPYATFAEAVAALLFQQQPYREGTDTPRIIFLHEINQMIRAQAASRPAAKPVPKPVLPPAPPLRQTGQF